MGDAVGVSQAAAIWGAVGTIVVALLGFLGAWVTARVQRRAVENERKLSLFEEQDRLLEQNRKDADRARGEEARALAERDRLRAEIDRLRTENDELRTRAVRAERQVTEWIEKRQGP